MLDCVDFWSAMASLPTLSYRRCWGGSVRMVLLEHIIESFAIYSAAGAFSTQGQQSDNTKSLFRCANRGVW